MKYLNDVMTFDIGVHTAFAYWQGTLHPDIGEFVAPKKYGEKEQRLHMAEKFKLTILEYEPRKIYLENVVVYRSQKSITAAIKGSLRKLMFLLERYESVCDAVGIPSEMIDPTKWKGQMDKEATAHKVKLINGLEYPSDHITDAVGMGFGLMGMFEWEVRKK